VGFLRYEKRYFCVFCWRVILVGDVSMSVAFVYFNTEKDKLGEWEAVTIDSFRLEREC